MAEYSEDHLKGFLDSLRAFALLRVFGSPINFTKPLRVFWTPLSFMKFL